MFGSLPSGSFRSKPPTTGWWRLSWQTESPSEGCLSKGVRLGNWLTVKQVQTLLNSADAKTIKCLGDRAILAFLMGGGLRRAEAAATQAAYIQQRDGRGIL